MTHRMQALASEIVRLQAELDQEIERRRKVLGWTLKERIVEFEHGVAIEHRRLRTGIVSFLARSSLATILTAPVIYSLILPFLVIDAWVSLYQAVCFRAYGIPRVRRSDYIAFDRQHLRYLNWIEAANCLYCGYVNGLIAYIREIASRTEQYWCPIKHALRITDPHRRYHEFLEYGDADGYRARLQEFRRRLQAEPEARADHPQPGGGA
ncbi:hypothetical protein [Labrys monachus]|uniref:Uncharacterized protein n=1 Tax=Labrys monachus TaxID=217067 RepID=A0ABU0FGT8_9HYPH|nr:hypothetical protein [Labrys monachus]MDQ0393318.1 hypothetical protein [Labrys monachus]